MQNTDRIYLSSPHMHGNEMKYIQSAFNENWIAPLGPNVDEFENSLSSYCESKYAAALSSGTAAIHLALIILGIKSGDEVVASSFTFSATINPIIYQGASPVFIDSELSTWNMDPELLEKAIKARLALGKRVKAIIVVHLYGMPANMNEINRISNQYGIPVIEDAAEALGSRYFGKHTGSLGKAGILSFNGNKIITTSGGGAILSDDYSIIEKAKFLATQARDKAPHYQHSEIGFNYRMSNILAGIGRGQIEVIDLRVKQKRIINNWYRDFFNNDQNVNFQTEPSKDYFSNYWLSCIVLKSKAKINRHQLFDLFEKDNIESRPLWKPMHLQPVFLKHPAYTNGISENLFNHGLCLPSDTKMAEKDFDRIEGVLKKAFQ